MFKHQKIDSELKRDTALKVYLRIPEIFC